MGKKTTVFSLIILLVLFSCSSFPFNQSGKIYNFEKGLQFLTREIVKSLRNEELYRVAVNDFLRIDGNRTILGAAVSEELTTAFFSADVPFSLVERNQLEAAIQELQLGMTAVFDENQAAELGRMVGADALVIGSITPFDTYIKLNSRIFSIEDGRVIAAASVKIARTPEVDSMLNGGTASGGTAGSGTAASGQPVQAAQPVKSPLRQEIEGFTVELTGFRREGSKLWADFLVTYHGGKEEDWLGFYNARIVDAGGKTYDPTHGGTMRLTDGWGGLTCVKDVPIIGTVPFDVGSAEIGRLSLLEIEFRDRGKLYFKNLSIQ